MGLPDILSARCSSVLSVTHNRITQILILQMFILFWFLASVWREKKEIFSEENLLRLTPPLVEQAQHTQPKRLSNVMMLLLDSHDQYEVMNFTFSGVG